LVDGDDELFPLGGGLRPIGIKDVQASKKTPEDDFVPLKDSELPVVDDVTQPAVTQLVTQRSQKQAESESKQFNALLEKRLAKVKAATVDISKQLDEIEPHFTTNPVDEDE
jgi:hypothetical protein